MQYSIHFAQLQHSLTPGYAVDGNLPLLSERPQEASI
jgi:hypothetical protein